MVSLVLDTHPYHKATFLFRSYQEEWLTRTRMEHGLNFRSFPNWLVQWSAAEQLPEHSLKPTITQREHKIESNR